MRLFFWKMERRLVKPINNVDVNKIERAEGCFITQNFLQRYSKFHKISREAFEFRICVSYISYANRFSK